MKKRIIVCLLSCWTCINDNVKKQGASYLCSVSNSLVQRCTMDRVRRAAVNWKSENEVNVRVGEWLQS